MPLPASLSICFSLCLFLAVHLSCSVHPFVILSVYPFPFSPSPSLHLCLSNLFPLSDPFHLSLSRSLICPSLPSFPSVLSPLLHPSVVRLSLSALSTPPSFPCRFFPSILHLGHWLLQWCPSESPLHPHPLSYSHYFISFHFFGVFICLHLGSVALLSPLSCPIWVSHVRQRGEM